MSDQGKSAPADRLQESHDNRTCFQTLAYNAALSLFIVFALILCFGVLYPPPLDTKAPDWGAAIVSRAVSAWPVLFGLFSGLGSWLGLTLLRGAHDMRLDCNGGGQ